jgi:Secretion system C-terminal sorting domain
MKIFYQILILTIFGINVQTRAQELNITNLVPNSSFENGVEGRPNGLGQINYCDDWKEINSPDWSKESPGLFQTSTIGPHTGLGFAGYSMSEGIQVKLNSQIEAHSMLSIGFWFSPESFMLESEINFYLRNSEYFEINNAPDINMENSFHVMVPIPEYEYQPGQWYHYEIPPFLWTSESSPNWLVMIGNTLGTTYVFVDDIVVYQFPPCWHTCVEDAGPLTIKTTMDSYLYEEPLGATAGGVFFDHSTNPDVINVAVGNTTNNFAYFIENAVRVKFLVLGTNDQIIWSEDSYDYNGLHDPDYPDFAVIWNGEMLDGGFLPADTYIYSLKIWQCQGPTIEIQSDLYHETYNPPAIASLGSRTNDNIELCCEENFIIQNTQYFPLADEGWLRLDANDFILAGQNVDSGQPSGQVVVNNNAKVAYYAANAINLEPGFVVSDEGEFEAGLYLCGAAPRNFNSMQRNITRRHSPLTPDINAPNSLTIAPNPTKSEITLSSELPLQRISIYSAMGNLVLEYINSFKSTTLDLSALSQGIYFLYAQTKEGVLIERIIKE